MRSPYFMIIINITYYYALGYFKGKKVENKNQSIKRSNSILYKKYFIFKSTCYIFEKKIDQ